MRAMEGTGSVRQVSQQTTVQAPVKGLNSIGPVAGMDPSDALVLINWFPQAYGVAARRGWIKHSTGLDGRVQTLMTYPKPGTDVLFAIASSGKMYNATVAGPIGAPVLTGLSNGWWQHLIAKTSGGQFLLACNGVDDWIKYDGLTITRVTAADVTGVDPKLLIQFELHQRRLWAVQINTTLGWYGAPDAIQGAFTKFDFGPLFRRGGNLAMLVTWTIDDGDGADDLLVAISTEGEAAVYSGIDPANAATWQLQGVYFIGAPPVGHRFALKTAGDVTVVTEYGLTRMSQGLLSTKLNLGAAGIAEERIQAIMSNLMSAYKNELGWQPVLYPDENMLLINVPPQLPEGPFATKGSPGVFAIAGDASFRGQVVQNTITGAWSLFRGYNAECWTLGEDKQLFFGNLDGEVGLAWQGYQDGQDYLTLSGDSYSCLAQPAFNYFGTPGNNKHYKLYRLNLLSDGSPQVYSELRIAFDVSPVTPPTLVPRPSPASYWDVDLWDVAKWSGFLNTYKHWRTANGIGFAATLSISVIPDADTLWMSTDWVYEVGGIW